MTTVSLERRWVIFSSEFALLQRPISYSRCVLRCCCDAQDGTLADSPAKTNFEPFAIRKNFLFTQSKRFLPENVKISSINYHFIFLLLSGSLSEQNSSKWPPQ